jgi:hypothetical protein
MVYTRRLESCLWQLLCEGIEGFVGKYFTRARAFGNKHKRRGEKAVTSAHIEFTEAEREHIKQRGCSLLEFYLHVDVMKEGMCPDEIVGVLELRLSDDVKNDELRWKEIASIVRAALNLPEFVDFLPIGTVVYKSYTPPISRSMFYARLIEMGVYQAEGRQIAGSIDRLIEVVERLERFEGITTGRNGVIVKELDYFKTEKPTGTPGICEVQIIDIGGYTYDSRTEKGQAVGEWLREVRNSYASSSGFSDNISEKI